MEALDADVRMRWAKLPPHPRFEGFGRVRITKDRFAFPEKPPDLDQGAGIGGCARERRECGDYNVAFFHHCDVLFINRTPRLEPRRGCIRIFVQRRQAAHSKPSAYFCLRCRVRDGVRKKHIRSRQIGYRCHTFHQIGLRGPICAIRSLTVTILRATFLVLVGSTAYVYGLEGHSVDVQAFPRGNALLISARVRLTMSPVRIPSLTI